MAGSLFFRERDGAPVGPIEPIALDVLFGTRIVDETTPVSWDGVDYQRLRDVPELIERALRARDAMLEGSDPWAEPPAPEPAVPGEVSLSDQSPLALLFRCAALRSRGRLTVTAHEGQVILELIDGKIVAIDTTVERLGLGSHLIDTGAVSVEALDEAVTQAFSRFGGDVGGALIGLGKIPPHVYVEAYSKWARGVLADLVQWGVGTALMEVCDIKSPPMPLGLDRAAALIEAARTGLDRGALEIRLADRRARTLIPASVEGLTLEDLRLPPKELRIVKAIDGTKTLDATLDLPGGEAALAAIYAAIEGGFVVLGDDPEVPRELEQLRVLEAELHAAPKKSPLDILGVRATASDAEVHARYMTLAKLHHPDRLRQGVLPALAHARRQMFALVQGAYEAVETEDKRQALDQLKEFGVANAVDEQAVVRAILEAETLFKKAEILTRMRKYSEAIGLLDEALARKPDDPEFRIHRSYCRHMARTLEAERAVSEITSELKKQPSVAAGYLFLARLHKSMDKQDQAVRAFKKVLELDPRNHEAETELRLTAMRKEKAAAKKKWL